MSHNFTQSHIEPGKVKNLRVDVPEVLRSSCTFPALASAPRNGWRQTKGTEASKTGKPESEESGV